MISTQMNRGLKLTCILSIALLIGTNSIARNVKTMYTGPKIDKSILELHDLYGYYVFAAVISIEEIPVPEGWKKEGLSNIQWDMLEKKLSTLDKSLQKNLIRQLDNDFNKIEENLQKNYLQRINYWCRGRLQYKVFSQFRSFSQDEFIYQLFQIEEFQNFIKSEILIENQDVNSMSSYQISEAWLKTLNYLSSLSDSQQINVFIEIYQSIDS